MSYGESIGLSKWFMRPKHSCLERLRKKNGIGEGKPLTSSREFG